MVGAASGSRLRCEPVGGRVFSQRQYVSDEERNNDHTAPGRIVRSGFDVRHVVHAAGRTGGSGTTSRDRARANGTPFLSFFTPSEMLALARDAGFQDVQHVSAATLAQRYFAGRTDGLRPPNNSEELLVAKT
ncbi:MAG TPA: hypothetical protein VGE93_11105 [Bryobacteraceae bacterium]